MKIEGTLNATRAYEALARILSAREGVEITVKVKTGEAEKNA